MTTRSGVALRTLLESVATRLRQTDFANPLPRATAICELRHACGVLTVRAGTEVTVHLRPLRGELPDLVARAEAATSTLQALVRATLERADEVEHAPPASRASATSRLVACFDELASAQRDVLAREDEEIGPALTARLSARQLQALEGRALTNVIAKHSTGCAAWFMALYDADELARWLRDLTLRSPAPIRAICAQRLQAALGDKRYAHVVRLAGLELQLELPYTPSGAELTGAEEERNVLDVLRRRRLWRYEVPSEESYVGRFERAAEELLGVRHVHATVSGTVALQIALLGAGVGPGDEVVIPAVTWVGCANAVILCGAGPVTADVDDRLGLDPADVERRIGPRTKAIMAVSLHGNPCDVERLRQLAHMRGVALLEDACQSAGVSVGGRRLGSFGEAAAFSTNFMKFVAAGDGGFLATDRDDVYELAVAYTGGKTFPSRKRPLKLAAPIVAFSTLRMNELTGAVALAQIERLDELLARLRGARDRIFDAVGEGRSFRRILGNDAEGDAGWCTPLRFPTPAACQAFARALRGRGVQHVTTSKEVFAGAEIHHCYPAMASDVFISGSGGHWATEFEAMLAQGSQDSLRDPWTRAFHGRAAVAYPEGFMDRSLARLEQIAMIQVNPRLEPHHCDTIATAIRQADAEVAAATGAHARAPV